MTPEGIVDLLRRTKATLHVDHEGRVFIQTIRDGKVVPTERWDGQLTKALDEHAQKVLQ